MRQKSLENFLNQLISILFFHIFDKSKLTWSNYDYINIIFNYNIANKKCVANNAYFYKFTIN